MSEGAPVRNSNAAKHGLYASQPTRRVTVPAMPSTSELAVYAQDLADGALWISEALEEYIEKHPVKAEVPRAVGLYASVAQELYQVAAELEGRSGIKAASLGRLSDERFEMLMKKEAKALALILSQCVSAWKRVQDEQEILRYGLVDSEGELRPALNYLAGHMRSAKRIMREMAANLAWKDRGEQQDDDLSIRLMKEIETEANSGS